MEILQQIEAILFVASKPVGIADLAKTFAKDRGDIVNMVDTLRLKYSAENSGIVILLENDTVQMAANSACVEITDKFVKSELLGELTKAQLETMTVIAYQGPITRPELEQIRSVNCSLIIRNLLMRGLIEESDSKDKPLPVYTLSMNALAALGITNVSELPDFTTLHDHDFVAKALGHVVVGGDNESAPSNVLENVNVAEEDAQL